MQTRVLKIVHFRAGDPHRAHVDWRNHTEDDANDCDNFSQSENQSSAVSLGSKDNAVSSVIMVSSIEHCRCSLSRVVMMVKIDSV